MNIGVRRRKMMPVDDYGKSLPFEAGRESRTRPGSRLRNSNEYHSSLDPEIVKFRAEVPSFDDWREVEA
jgi:hypothetical protein